MTKFYLVKFVCNWADEFDLNSLSVCDSVRYDHEKAIAETNDDVALNDLYFGTNEALTDLTVGELFKCYKFIEISESTYLELRDHLVSHYSAGWGTWFRWPSEVLEDQSEDYDG